MASVDEIFWGNNVWDDDFWVANFWGSGVVAFVAVDTVSLTMEVGGHRAMEVRMRTLADLTSRVVTTIKRRSEL